MGAYVLLSLAIASFWIPNKRTQRIFGLIFFVLALLTGIYLKVLDIVAIPFLIAFLLLCYSLIANINRTLQIITSILFVVLSVLLAAHLVPGFHNIINLSNIMISERSIPYTQYLNYDKAVIGLFLLHIVFSPAKTKEEWISVFKNLLPFTILACAVIFPLGIMLGFVGIDIDPEPDYWRWFIPNLLFTCIAEEAFFRGYMQKNISTRLSKWNSTKGPIIAVLITSIVFGLVHFGGGVNFVILATVGGIAYGLIYLKTNKIESCILLHFIVNSIHFNFFSYPALSV